MTLVHPLFLLLLLLPAAFLAYEWRQTTRKLSLILKAASFAAVALALAEPTIRMPETKAGVVVLVDTSASISDQDLVRERELVHQMAQTVGHNWMRVVPFAHRPRDLNPEEVQGGWKLQRTSDEAGKSTDLEAAIREGISAVPNGRIPRLVLISDGKENEGSTARAIAQVRHLGIPVDTISLAGRPETGLRILGVSLPGQAYASEQIPVDLTVQSPRTARATVAIQAEGKPLGESAVNLKEGANQVHVRGRINSSGVTTLSGHLSLEDGSSADFEQAINLRRAHVLYVSQDPPGSDANLLSALGQAQFEMKTDAALLDTKLRDTQLVILNNLNLKDLSDVQKTNLEEFVKNGGGLLLIGGEKQVYKDQKEADALDRALPADLAPPKSPEGTAVGLIIDKSSSMEGRKIDLARLSAIGVVDHLRPVDSIGVLIFDNSYQWAVPIRHAEDKSLIKRLISGITPDGGTQIAPALAEAYRRVLATHATYKHIVLLTDGISEEGDSLDVAREAQKHLVTISTVGLGQDVNRSYLERVAEFSGGKSYFLNEPQGLEQILLKDVMEYTGSTAVEKSLTPLVREKAEVLDGTGIESAPPLKGYTRFTAKPTAETVLSIDAQKNDPLYVRWQYGLGRSAVFTSDAKSRWAADWIHWPGFDKFWINVTRDLLPHTTASDATAALDAANNDLVVTYHLGSGTEQPTRIPQVYVLGPNRFEKPIDVVRTAAGNYEGRLHIGELRGLFRVRPLEDSAAFPEVGFYRQQEEMLDYGANTGLLRQIASLSGGQFNPEPSEVFRSDGRRIPSVWRLWPGLLGLAIALTILELLVRKWRGIFQRFSVK
jgi:Ca-activated chloride channel family protein